MTSMTQGNSERDLDVADVFSVSFPAMRGVQAGREYFVIMCPLRYIPKLFLFDEEDLPPELRAQRTLNRNRLPALVRYMLDNRNDYVFSALTASVDGAMKFTSQEGGVHGQRLGVLSISMDSKFLINDGQHRRAAIEEALKQDPSLAEETIAIVVFADEGLARSQQMFADLNRHSVRPARSIGVLYDHRDDDSGVVRLVVLKSEFYRGLVEMERSTLSATSRKLFTLSALYGATQALLQGTQYESVESAADVSRRFWETLSELIPEWAQVRAGTLTAREVRRDFIHSHGTVLHAFGRVGNTVLRDTVDADTGRWDALQGLASIDWSRSNSDLWEGRALIGGRVSKAATNVTLTTNAIRLHLGMPLSPEERRIEDSYQGGTDV